MHKILSLCVFVFLIAACRSQKKQADLIVYNATIYTVDSLFSVQQAIAIKDGKILELNSTEYIKNNYDTKESFNADGKTIFPGFIDAHCHFYAYGKGLQEIDLVGTKSFAEVLEKVSSFRRLMQKYLKK